MQALTGGIEFSLIEVYTNLMQERKNVFGGRFIFDTSFKRDY